MNFIFYKKSINANGFTLVELIVVMAVFSILAAIGIYSFNAYLPRQRQYAAARVVVNDLVQARIRAIKTREPQQFNLFFNRYTIGDATDTFLTRNFNNDYEWDDIQVRTFREPTFNINGTIDNIATISIMCGDNEPVEITMTITGNIKISP